MKTNVPLKIDSELLRKARILATQEGSSISALLSRNLKELVRSRKECEQARSSALARLETGYALNWTSPCSRDELHRR